MPVVREVQAGVWHWEAPHPEWKQDDEWGELVSSYAIDGGEGLLLFDPLAVPGEIEQRVSAVVLTCPWHERDARGLVERLGVPLFLPPPDEDSPDMGWLADADVEVRLVTDGDPLPSGVQAFPGAVALNDVVYWVERHRVVVAGDTMIDRGNGLELPADWIGDPFEQVREGLRQLLELPVEHVLATHGGPADRAALERALA
jgi:glyoxylase-like metal-dependent hydrolase (beta-lactamase superfamily II)